MSQYGLNWRQLRDQPDHKATVVYFDRATGATNIGPITKDLLDSTLLFEENISSNPWDPDVSTKPSQIQFDTLNFNNFLGTEDTAIYTDVHLPGGYDPLLKLKIGMYYRLDTGNLATAMRVNFDYAFFKEGSAVPSSYTANPFTLTPTADENLHVALNAEIPAQGGSFDARDMLTLRFARNAVTDVLDVNTEGLAILSIFLYQEV